MHFLVINSAIRKFSETTQTGRALYAHFSPGPALFNRGATIRSGEIFARPEPIRESVLLTAGRALGDTPALSPALRYGESAPERAQDPAAPAP